MPDEEMLKLALKKHACFVHDLDDFNSFARYLNKEFADEWMELIHKAYAGLKTEELDNSLIHAQYLYNQLQLKAYKMVEHLLSISNKAFGHYREVIEEFGFEKFQSTKMQMKGLADHLMHFYFTAKKRIDLLSANGYHDRDADDLGNLSAELNLAFHRIKELKELKSLKLTTLNISVHGVWSKTCLVCEAGNVIYKKNQKKLKNYILNDK